MSLHRAYLGIVVGIAVFATAAKPPDPKRIRAISIGADTITVDGMLDEPIWQKAPVGTDFIERTPYPGRPAAVRTEFRVVYSASTVYVGLKLFTDGRPPRGWERSRDNFGLFSDDAISLKFDVRLDKRTTVGFATNPTEFSSTTSRPITAVNSDASTMSFGTSLPR